MKGTAWLIGILIATVSLMSPAGAAPGLLPKRLEPLPLDVAAVYSDLSDSRASTMAVSPHGDWIAVHHGMSGATFEYDATLKFTTSGVPAVDEYGEFRTRLVNVRTGAVQQVGSTTSSAWSPAWSPDGSKLAYFSDEGGRAALWIRDTGSGQARALPSIVPRGLFAFQGIHWLPDNRRVVLKAVVRSPEVRADGQLLAGEAQRARLDASRPSVTVWAAPEPDEASSKQGGNAEGAAAAADRLDPPMELTKADLLLVDTESGEVTRIAEHASVQAHAISPDGKHVAYVSQRGYQPATMKTFFDLTVYELASGQRRTIERLTDWIGIEWNWSPDSRQLVFNARVSAAGGGEASGLWIVSLESGAMKRVESARDPWEPGAVPLWDAAGEHLYLVAGGTLRQVHVASGRMIEIGGRSERQLRRLISRRHSPTVWSNDGGVSIFAAFEDGAGQSGLERINVRSGARRVVLTQAKRYSDLYDVSDVTQDIAFVAGDAKHLPDVWLYKARGGRAEQLTQLNPRMDEYVPGETRIIQWRDLDGRELRGALLLPSNYRAGKRVPLVVWVYGGAMGSQSADTFGLWGARSNMQILATRGYAVLYPDAPLRLGRSVEDLASTVLPGVNAAIELGYADPERLAVMGHSYGSYSTLALITRTTRFKAAVISAVADQNLFSGYASKSSDGSVDKTGYYEKGQGNMGATPWEVPARYQANSPFFLFDRIETPLLMGHGTGDFLPTRNPEGIFVALQRLGKPVEYRLYEGEEHAILRQANVIDWWQRRLDFLARNLGLTVDEKGVVH